MQIALDATYSVDRQPSGIAIYSRELLSGLSENYPQDEFLFCYRPKQWLRTSRPSIQNVRKRLLQPPLPTFRAQLFHALNQRVDRRPAKRVVATFHDLFVMTGEYSTREFRSRFTGQAKRAAQNSDLIIAVSEFTASQVNSLLGFARSQIRVIPHGVHQPPELNRKRENIILFVGALQIRKNVIRLIDAFERLPATCDCCDFSAEPWRLVLVGAPSGFQAALILDRIGRSKCRARIQVTGYVSQDELDDWYARASVFAFPSLDEGFGMTVLEAMAHGAPVVTSNRSALVEIAMNAALLVDPYNVDELEDALSRLVQDPDLRIKLSELGRLRAQLYPWERAITATHAIYEELVR